MTKRRLMRFFQICMIVCLCLVAAACTGSREGGDATPSPGTETPSASPDLEARRLLEDAEQAAESLERYAYTLKLTQKMESISGAEGEVLEEAVTESEGRVETRPRRVDQTVRVAFDGESQVEYRTILVPEGAYVYEFALDEWARMPQEEAAEMLATLSDFQVDLPEAVRQVAALGPAAVEQSGDGITVRYEGSGKETHQFVTRLLESTLGWSQQEPAVRESLQVRHLLAELVLDPERLWPVAFRIELEAALTMTDPEGSYLLIQSFNGTYGEHDEAAAVEVPEEAQQAPRLDSPIDGE